MLPVESQRREAASEIAAAERRLKLAEEKHAAALANWKAKLRALGLPDDISPSGLATMAGQCERLAELEARIENRRDDMQPPPARVQCCVAANRRAGRGNRIATRNGSRLL